jgi:hypothetical protein
VLTSDLQVLLNKAVPLKPKLTVKKQNRKPSPDLMALLGRMDNRAWREQTLVFIVAYIKESAGELLLIKHLRTCEECRAIAQLDVERYLGSRSVWFLDLQNDMGSQDWDEEDCADYLDLKGCPRADDYKIGSYWSGSSPDTLRFIDDRANWAEKLIRKKMLAARSYYKRVKAWDLDGQPPFEPEIENTWYQPNLLNE